ncbi:hypothetical protein BVY01_02040 [bacterium I07]|nr:hypothetical protein BVY01_02040 [bacterium I07]
MLSRKYLNVAGSNKTTLITDLENLWYPSWSPDDRYIVYVAAGPYQHYQDQSYLPVPEVYAVRVQDGEIFRITTRMNAIKAV